jgi:alpha-L-rhamnosidase
VPHESLNHYSKGAVIGFLHRYVAGLERLEPTWRRFRVRPRPGGGLTEVEVEHDSPHGRIAVRWRTEKAVRWRTEKRSGGVRKAGN